MRCREARLRISELSREKQNLDNDRDLQKHLQQCSACAEYAKEANMLERIFVSAGQDDKKDITPLEMQKQQLVARVAASQRSKVKKSTSRRSFPGRQPAYGIGVVAVVMILAVLTLVPFKYDRTIGYDVALAGVEKDLAENDERICDMLLELGFVEAAVDVLSCDTTCRLLILDLKSQEDAKMVVAAIASVNPTELTSDVIPIRTSRSATLLDRANESLRNKDIE